jgi:hypothetical protein
MIYFFLVTFPGHQYTIFKNIIIPNSTQIRQINIKSLIKFNILHGDDSLNFYRHILF